MRHSVLYFLMMMDRFQFKLVAVVLVLVMGTLAAPWIRDLAVSVRTTVDVGRYALTPRSVLIERLDSAEQELQRIRYQAVLFQSLELEYVALRKEVLLADTAPYGVARVVSAPPKTHYDTLLIAAGADDGVLVGDLVSAHGVLVGVVTEVSQHSAITELYSSPGHELDARIGDSDAIVVVRGVGGGSLEAYVPDSILVVPGDSVVDAKSGYVFGSVARVTKRDIDTSAALTIVLAAPVSSFSIVSLTHPLPQ